MPAYKDFVELALMCWRQAHAQEAVLSASYAESAKERQALLDLARTWTQAALIERHAQGDADTLSIAA